jgi:tetratricopeptide (TPR) repeat protein
MSSKSRHSPSWFFKRLVVAGGVLICVAMAVRAVRSARQQREAEACLEQAVLAETAGELERAAAGFGRYVGLIPGDVAARARLSVLQDRLAKTGAERLQAFLALEAALRRAPELADLRRRIVMRAMGLHRFGDAKGHLEQLLEASPDDGSLWALAGECDESLGRFSEALQDYETAIRNTPHQLDAYLRLAELQRSQFDRAAAADEVLDKMIAANPLVYQGYLARGQSRRKQGSIATAAVDFERARELAPQQAEPWLAWSQTVQDLAAEQATSGNRPEAARLLEGASRDLERALFLHADEPRFYQELAQLEQQAGRSAEAAVWLRRGLDQLPREAELKCHLADLLLDLREVAEARTLISELRSSAAAVPVLRYLNARLLMADKQWTAAGELLEGARPQFPSLSRLALRADLFLAECFEHLVNPERQVAILRRAVRSQPLSIPARAGLAAALRTLGRTDEALNEARKLCRLQPGFTDEALLAAEQLRLAHLLILDQYRLPAGTRHWREVDALLDRIGEAPADPAVVTLLRAELLLAQGKFSEAREYLESQRQQGPADARVWTALAKFAALDGSDESAARLVNSAQEMLGDSIELRRALGEYWSQRRGMRARQELSKLAVDCAPFSLTEQTHLLRSIAAACQQQGDRQAARRLWEEVAARERDELDVRLNLWEMARQDHDLREMTALSQEIRRIEGAGPHWCHAEAHRLILEAGEEAASGHAKARHWLAAAARLRPGWQRIPASLAALEDAAGDPEKALKEYQRALELGAHEPRVLRRTAELLCRAQRYAAAEELLQTLEQQRRDLMADELLSLWRP